MKPSDYPKEIPGNLIEFIEMDPNQISSAIQSFNDLQISTIAGQLQQIKSIAKARSQTTLYDEIVNQYEWVLDQQMIRFRESLTVFRIVTRHRDHLVDPYKTIWEQHVLLNG